MRYVKYNPDLEMEVIGLLNVCFPQKKITRESFNWKHFPTYLKNKNIAYVAIEKGKVIAFVDFSPLKVNSGIFGNRLFYSCTVQATHPSWRRMGIISDLTKLAETKMKSTDYLGFSNSDGVKIDKFSKTINYSILGRLTTGYFATYRGLFHVKQEKFGFKEVSKVTGVCSDFIQIEKSKDYLNWKFLENPKRKYNLMLLTENSKAIGFLIYTKHKLKLEVHLITLKDPLKLKIVFPSILEFAYGKGAMVVSFTYLKNSFWNKNLPYSFIKKRTDIYFTVKSGKSDFTDTENWLIQGGDIQ